MSGTQIDNSVWRNNNRSSQYHPAYNTERILKTEMTQVFFLIIQIIEAKPRMIQVAEKVEWYIGPG